MSIVKTAIYARKSTNQVGVRDAERSVTRQVDHARAYAAHKGWSVADEHIYIDDGISGAEFAHRPGFLRLMNVRIPDDLEHRFRAKVNTHSGQVEHRFREGEHRFRPS